MTSVVPWVVHRNLQKTGNRGLVPGLVTPHPFGPATPAVYQEDDFAQRFLLAFDESMAPVLCTLDNLEAYFDPQLTPEDFLGWLAGWVGVLLDETWPIERRRALVADAVGLYTLRGTVAGMTRQVELYTGGRVEIDDGGGVLASPSPLGPLPGSPGYSFTVRVFVDDPDGVDPRRVELLVAATKPAHLAHRVEIVREGATPASAAPADAVSPAPASASAAPEPPNGQEPAPEAPE